MKFKNKPCLDCGGVYPSYVMDFDHRPNTIKLFDVSNPKTTNREKIQAEIDKCDLVCANCHRIRTYNRLGKLL
jgi:NAD-dependent dihydropyrimidine dehydrogenase PreA subunit